MNVWSDMARWRGLSKKGENASGRHDPRMGHDTRTVKVFMDNAEFEALKSRAQFNDRSLSAQARVEINEGARVTDRTRSELEHIGRPLNDLWSLPKKIRAVFGK